MAVVTATIIGIIKDLVPLRSATSEVMVFCVDLISLTSSIALSSFVSTLVNLKELAQNGV